MAHRPDSPVSVSDDSTTVRGSRASVEDAEEGEPMLAYPAGSTRLPDSEDVSFPWPAGQISYHHALDRVDEEESLHEEKDTEFSLPTHQISGFHKRINPLRFILILFPSFIARPLGYYSDVKPSRANDTSYLIGLRGIAAVIVVIQHTSEEYYPENHGCYGDGPPEEDHYIQLPFLHLINNGSFAVALFFVISGFALSYGSLRKIYAGNAEAAIAAMPSSVLRRPIRLFLPIVPVYALSYILIQLGVIYNMHQLTFIAPMPNIFLEAWYGFQNLLVINTKPYRILPYFPQGWTLPEEYTGSLLLFLCCLAFARTSIRVRVIGVSIVAGYQFYIGEWIGFLFLAGMLLAELRHFRAKRPELKPIYRWVLTIFSTLMLLPALFFGSWPINGTPSQCVGFRYFASIHIGAMDQVRFFLAWAGVALVLALENLPFLQALFNTSLVLYFGDISYSLYLVHWMVAQGWSKHVAYAMIGSGYTKLSACLTAVSLTLILGVWLADLLWRLGDAQSVRFARWTANRLGV